MLTPTKWGYFEVGAYIGTKDERERVLSDFTLGRLDVGASDHFKASSQISPLSAMLLLQLLHHSTPHGAPYR